MKVRIIAKNRDSNPLSSLGYDVWMLNVRGNRYSQKHKTLNPNYNKEFWSFSWDESARYDYPTTIDYILDQTRQEDLSFVGFSMGTTQYLVLLSELPEYNRKIKVGYLLGPAALIGGANNPILYVKIPMFKAFEFLGIPVMYPSSYADQSHRLCSSSYIMATLCKKLWSSFANSDNTLDTKTALTMLSHVPAGTSTRTFLHYVQLLKHGRFTQYDYGTVQNIHR